MTDGKGRDVVDVWNVEDTRAVAGCQGRCRADVMDVVFSEAVRVPAPLEKRLLLASRRHEGLLKWGYPHMDGL